MVEVGPSPSFTDEESDLMADTIRDDLAAMAARDSLALNRWTGWRLRLMALTAVGRNMEDGLGEEDWAHVDHLVYSAMIDVLDSFFPLP